MRDEGPVHLLVNPRAGQGRAGERAAIVCGLIEDAALPVVLSETKSPQDTVNQAAEAWASGARAVVACGGDGTLNQVLQGLMQARSVDENPVLGLVAAGTGNDNARSLGIPTEPNEVAAALVDGLQANRTARVDLARVQTEDADAWFVGVLSTGFDSSVNERANRRRWPPGRAKYILAMVAELGAFHPVDYQVSVDGREIDGLGMLVAVGNGASYGGGMRICPTAQVDDGYLDLTWVGPVSKPAFLKVFPRVFAGTHLEHPQVRALRGVHLTINAPGQVAYADGERIGSLPVQIDLVKGVLEVLGAPRSLSA